MKTQPETVTSRNRHDRSATTVSTVRSRARLRAAEEVPLDRPTTSEPAPIDPPATTASAVATEERRFDEDGRTVEGGKNATQARYNADTRRLLRETNIERDGSESRIAAGAFAGGDDDELVDTNRSAETTSARISAV